ncbi:MAG: RNA polymerase sigma factor [Planctomycetes bacterium]|nr:RNA polymerase sigma factor [Planctomycetota bacterium]NOG53916.1 RNA polymerase sigma factor [Planctomycetota bacterium]
MALSLTESDLARWMKTLGPRLIAVSRGICRDRDVAEDLVQEAFLKLWNTPPDGPERVVPSWMRRVVVNLSINHLRRSKRADSLPEFSNDPALRHDRRPEHDVDVADNLQRVRDAMERLPDDKRAILVLRVYEELSYQQIAEVLEIPVGTVMSRLNRARAALRDLIEEGLNNPEEEPLVFPLRKAAGGED